MLEGFFDCGMGVVVFVRVILFNVRMRNLIVDVSEFLVLFMMWLIVLFMN